MKQILPILTLTTLTAAAFADAGAAAPAAPAAAGLSYNRVGISRSSEDTDLTVSQLLGSSNVLVSLSTRNLQNNGNDSSNYVFMSVGYVFKNVVAGIDATASVGAAAHGSGSLWSINLRRSLSEVIPGLEAALAYSSQKQNSSTEKSWTYELSYNINKQYSIAYGLTDFNGSADNVKTVSVRYNF